MPYNRRIFFVSADFLCLIDKRLRQIPFGGLNVVALGDLYQLPSVCGPMIFVTPAEKINFPEFNVQLWNLFELCCLTQVMRQSNDLEIANLLSRVRVYMQNNHDIETLKSRVIPDHVHDPPRLRICHTLKRVDN